MKFLLLLTGSLVLSACAGSPQSDDSNPHVGWLCDGEPGTKSWQCQQRAMRNGRLVEDIAEEGASGEDRAPAGVLVEGVAVGSAVLDTSNPPNEMAKTPGSEVPRIPVVKVKADSQKLSWRGQLPGLDGRILENKVLEGRPTGKTDESGAPIESRPEVIPQPEPSFEIWEDELHPKIIPGYMDSNKVASRKMAPNNVTTANSVASADVNKAGASGTSEMSEKDKSAVLPLRSVETTSAGQGKRSYTVQLAALLSAADAQTFIQREQLLDLDLKVASLEREGKRFFVVTYGEFASRAEAQARWGALRQTKGLDVWVRPIR